MILEIIGLVATTMGLASILSKPKSSISTGVAEGDRIYDMARALAEFLLKRKVKGYLMIKQKSLNKSPVWKVIILNLNSFIDVIIQVQ